MKGTATGAAADSNRSNAAGAMGSSGRSTISRDVNRQMATVSLQSRNRNSHGSRKRVSLASNPSAAGTKRVTFNQLTSQLTVDEQNAEIINNQSVPLHAPEDEAARQTHTAGEHEVNEGGADESPDSSQKPKKKQQIKTVKINSKISQQRDTMQTAASRKQPAVLNSRSIQAESSQQKSSEKEEQGKELYDLGASYYDNEQPEGYNIIDDGFEDADEAAILAQRQQRRKSRYQQRIESLRLAESEQAAPDITQSAPLSEQHKNITIHSPRDSDYEQAIGDVPDIQVQQVSDDKLGSNQQSKAEVPVLSVLDLSEETSQAATGMHLKLNRDESVDKNNSIISEVDPAFEEQTPNHRALSKDQLPTGKVPSQAALATFQQRSLSNADQTIPPDCDTPKEVREVKKNEAKVHGRKGKAANQLLIGSKKAASGNYEHMVVDSAQIKQKTPINNGPTSSANKGHPAAWNFNLKSKIKRMQTVGRQPQRSSNRNAIISKSPLKNSPSINSKGMFTAFDIESAISRQKQTTGRRGRFEDARGRRDDRNGSSLNLTVDNQLDQLSLNIGKVTGQLRNMARDQLLSSEGREIEFDGATVKDAVTPGQGTFSMMSSNKGKAASPFTQTNRMRKRSNEPCQEIIASSSFRKNKMIISSGPVAKRSSTMRNKDGNEKGSKILDQRSQLSEQDMMKRSGGVGSAHSKFDVPFEDEEDSGFAAVDTDEVVRQRIENSNKKMMAVYTRNPYKVQSIDTIRLLEKQHSGLQPRNQLSQSRRGPDKTTTELYRAENHLALRNKRRSRVSAVNRGSIGSPNRPLVDSIVQDGSLTGRANRSDIMDDSADKSEYLVHLLQRLQESDANQGAVEKEFRLCLYQQVERELEKRERMLAQQVTWLRKQKQLCEVYGQSLSHVVQAMTQVPEQQKRCKDSSDGKRPKRLKNLNAELLQPVNTRRRKEEQIVAMHDPTMAASILAESVPEPREIVDTRQTEGFKSSMVNKRHSEQIRDQRDQVTPNHLLTSSLNSNSMFQAPEICQKDAANAKGPNHLLHQLVSICQRLRYSPDKVSYLRSLLRSVERYDHEMKKLLRHTYRKKSPVHQDGHRKSMDGTPHPLLSNFIESGVDEGKPSESEIRFYKLSLIQLNRLIQANKIHSTLVRMDMSKVAPAGTSTAFNSFHSKAGGGSAHLQSPLAEGEYTSRNDGLNTSVPPRHSGGEQLIDYFDRKLMERKSLETATKFNSNVPNSTRDQFQASLVKRAVDEDTMEEMSKEAKNFFAEDSVGEVRISHSHKKTIQKYRKKRKDMQATASVSKDGGIDFIKENKKNLLPFFTQQHLSDPNQSMSPQKEKFKTKEKKSVLQSQKVGAFTQSNSPSLDKHPMNQQVTDGSNGFIASGSLSVTQRNSQVSAFKPKVAETATSSVSNSEHFQRERLSQTRAVLAEPIKVKDNRTNFEITRQYAPNLNTATSQQRVVVGHVAVEEKSPIRQRKANVMNEVRSSRHKLIQSGHQIISDQSNRKNMLNFQLKHVSQKVPTSFLESQYDARLGNFNLRDKQSDYVSSSIIEASQQQSRFQSTAQSKALQNVLEQQRELKRGMRNQQQGITPNHLNGGRGHRRNNLSMTGCTVTTGSGKMGVKGSYSRDMSSVDDLGGQEILAQSGTYNKLIKSSKKGADQLPVTGSQTAMPNTMVYNGSSIAASSQNGSRLLPDRIRDAEPQQ